MWILGIYSQRCCIRTARWQSTKRAHHTGRAPGQVARALLWYVYPVFDVVPHITPFLSLRVTAQAGNSVWSCDLGKAHVRILEILQ